jgi:hypothetical protein
MRKQFALFCWLVLPLPPALLLVAQTQHITPFTGSWKMNVAKSKFNPSPGLKSATMTFAPDGTSTVEILDPQGKTLKYSYSWSGEKEVPVHGIEHATVITKLQDHTFDRTMNIAGKTVQMVHALISPDGKTMTVTVTGKYPHGRSMDDVELFEKQ